MWVGEEQAVFAGVSGAEWTTRTWELTGNIDVKVKIDFGNLFLTSLTVTGVDMDIRGPAARGGVITNSTLLTLIPRNNLEREGYVYFTMRMQPFNEVRLVWKQRKVEEKNENEGRNWKESVNIGSERGKWDIVKSGIIQTEYEKGKEIPGNTYFSLLYVPLNASLQTNNVRLTYDLHLLTPVLTWSAEEQSLVGRLTYRCLHTGVSLVQVTFLSETGQHLELTYRKTCLQPKVYISEEREWRQWKEAAGLAVVLVGLVLCWHRKRLRVKDASGFPEHTGLASK